MRAPDDMTHAPGLQALSPQALPSAGTPLRELIAAPGLPEELVIVLQEAMKTDETLTRYLLTPQLAQALDKAFTFLHAALDSHSSKAAFVHGSQGVGKSHFLAVLALLIQGNVRGRALPPLAEILERHESWLRGRHFLIVPVSLLGAPDLETALLRAYTERVRKLAPEAAPPTFQVAEQAFAVARQLRARQGDATFFATLNMFHAQRRGRRIEGAWTARRFEAALRDGPEPMPAPPPAKPLSAPRPTRSGAVLPSAPSRLGVPPRPAIQGAGAPSPGTSAPASRDELFADVIAAFLRQYSGASPSAFLPLEDALAHLSQHAQSLGLDAVVLLLDDLSPWLATHVNEPGFLEAQSAKLSSLFNSRPGATWPVPLVSFLARNRDPREFVGVLADGWEGSRVAEALARRDSVLNQITLEDRNLPRVAARRLLNPVSLGAHTVLAAHCAQQLASLSPEAIAAQLAGHGERELLQRLYPANPALLACLQVLACVTQPSQGPLSLLRQFLLSQPEAPASHGLALGGLWDLFVTLPLGSELLQARRTQATRLWEEQLQPLLDSRQSDVLPLKTLLLAAAFPDLPCLQSLTPERLLALNPSSHSSPREAEALLSRAHAWSQEVPELRIEGLPQPTLRIHLPTIDIEPLLARARSHDTPAARRRKVRALLFAGLGISDTGPSVTHDFLWRGTHHPVEIVCESLQTLRDDAQLRSEGRWKLLLELPFDDERYGSRADLARLQRYQGAPTHTLAWLPKPYGEQASRELGRLVILEALLADESAFQTLTAHLTASQRTEAHGLFAQQHAQAQTRIQGQLQGAYLSGDASQWHSLEPRFQPRRSTASSLKAALEDLLDQALTHDFPEFPAFEVEITPAAVQTVWSEIQRALGSPLRSPISDPGSIPTLQGILLPLQLGEVREGVLHLSTHWKRLLACPQTPFTVGGLRAFIESEDIPGLPRSLQDLLILTFAAQTHYTFQHQGRSIEPGLDTLFDELELQEQRLPEESVWQEARRRMSVLFGMSVSEARSLAHVNQLGSALVASARLLWEPVNALATHLASLLSSQGADPSQSPRLRTVHAARALLDLVTWQSGLEAVQVLTAFRIETSEAAMAHILDRATELEELLGHFPDQVFNALRQIEDERVNAATGLLECLREALSADEHQIPLKARLGELQARALALLTQPVARSLEHNPGIPPEGCRENLERSTALALLGEIERQLTAGRLLSLSWSIRERS